MLVDVMDLADEGVSGDGEWKDCAPLPPLLFFVCKMGEDVSWFMLYVCDCGVENDDGFMTMHDSIGDVLLIVHFRPAVFYHGCILGNQQISPTILESCQRQRIQKGT